MKELKATEGYYLTQSADVAKEDRIFVTAIKGASVKESDWVEVTADVKEQHEKEVEQLNNEE
jgi:hypothetical protein